MRRDGCVHSTGSTHLLTQTCVTTALLPATNCPARSPRHSATWSSSGCCTTAPRVHVPPAIDTGHFIRDLSANRLGSSIPVVLSRLSLMQSLYGYAATLSHALTQQSVATLRRTTCTGRFPRASAMSPLCRHCTLSGAANPRSDTRKLRRLNDNALTGLVPTVLSLLTGLQQLYVLLRALCGFARPYTRESRSALGGNRFDASPVLSAVTAFAQLQSLYACGASPAAPHRSPQRLACRKRQRHDAVEPLAAHGAQHPVRNRNTSPCDTHIARRAEIFASMRSPDRCLMFRSCPRRCWLSCA